MSEREPLKFEVDESEAGQRLDIVLVGRFEGVGRAKARAMLEQGGVRVNGRRSRKGDRVPAGATIEVSSEPSSSRFHATPDDSVVLEIVYEDDAMVVVDKRAGVPSNPIRDGETGNVSSGLLARYPAMSDVGYSPREPGLVHRLDVDTSGLIVAAKTTEAFEALRASLSAGSWEKCYRALVVGEIGARLTVEAAIANHPSDPRRVMVASDPLEAARVRARSARSAVTPIERFAGFTLVEVLAEHARRHQVRAHLAFVGHPLVGDVLYGGPEEPELTRHFLHASRITLPHPISGKPVELSAKLPPELEAALARRR